MKKIIVFALIVAFASCKKDIVKEKNIVKDNIQLKEIYKQDQNERKSDNIDFGDLYVKDSLRRIRVQQLLDEGKVITGKDYARAAMVYQHGKDSTDFGKAVKFMKIAIEKDSTISKWLYAAATDRYLLSIGKPQIYGTQYGKIGDGPWKLDPIDTTKITDAERIKLGVRTLDQQREQVKLMNKD